MGREKGPVCVTGGTGYIGSWLIKVLFEQGYSVHTTVRPDPDNKRDLSFLTSLPGADGRHKIFRADLSHPESYDAAIQGCKGVLHVAAPMDFEDNEPEAVVTQRAVDGALGILKACLIL
ncbi:Bifunctional dihydroflavonol 4-reductase/flavanone 4-reductase [Hibiscus syriacus]|uniref:Bifunctional dihydroflavonol 4-reductase/flavanone 4-reductase n=1 Tax=Hibiscus syriacus TaxID=106335 RepID=A0A6A3A5V2_HIBSY|nr:vestitone reductase-like [Hibiscus syriacus]KAE8699724.1 Bifunctional dihydroflavonol 4-reductase/flavanone 4-reductase [Hibiscus syriacus]